MGQMVRVSVQVLLALGDLRAACPPLGATAVGHGLGQNPDVEQDRAVLDVLCVLKDGLQLLQSADGAALAAGARLTVRYAP